MVELFDVLGRLAGELDAIDKVTALAVALIVAKYLVDVLRARIVQRGLSGLEVAFHLAAGSLQWSYWTDRTRVLVTMVQSFVVGLLAALATGAHWAAAVGSGLVAAVGAKGLHDSGVLPGVRPSARGPAVVVDRAPRPTSNISRNLSLRTDIGTGHTTRSPDDDHRDTDAPNPAGH